MNIWEPFYNDGKDGGVERRGTFVLGGIPSDKAKILAELHNEEITEIREEQTQLIEALRDLESACAEDIRYNRRLPRAFNDGTVPLDDALTKARALLASIEGETE